MCSAVRPQLEALRTEEKTRSENLMIVDLIRNDLGRSCEYGSVHVPKLMAIESFATVHQLVSTIVGTLRSDEDALSVTAAAFPPGSMTGAPKISAMQIIEETEDAKRGLYSGAIGYFSPSGDFDFNVVIRSILYNSSTKYVSFSVGGAITINSVPEREYEECLLKAKAMREVLNNSL